jgi:drug/metabolite transporter (DMT)-like permease
MFLPEFGRAAAAASVTLGAVLTVASVLLSGVGSLTASRNRSRGLPFWPALGFGMLYGGAATTLVALWQGHSFAPPAVLSWWIALLYLSLAGSVVAFACFLSLQDRLGPGPAGTVGVMTPLIALAVSMAFEGFRPDLLTFVGAALAVLGNLLILRRGAAAPAGFSAGAAAAE